MALGWQNTKGTHYLHLANLCRVPKAKSATKINGRPYLQFVHKATRQWNKLAIGSAGVPSKLVASCSRLPSPFRMDDRKAAGMCFNRLACPILAPGFLVPVWPSHCFACFGIRLFLDKKRKVAIISSLRCVIHFMLVKFMCELRVSNNWVSFDL